MLEVFWVFLKSVEIRVARLDRLQVGEFSFSFVNRKFNNC